MSRHSSFQIAEFPLPLRLYSWLNRRLRGKNSPSALWSIKGQRWKVAKRIVAKLLIWQGRPTHHMLRVWVFSVFSSQFVWPLRRGNPSLCWEVIVVACIGARTRSPRGASKVDVFKFWGALFMQYKSLYIILCILCAINWLCSVQCT